jgi:putative transposase
MIDRETPLSILRPCELLGLSRSSLYYRPQPISEADRRLMRRIDEVHLRVSMWGAVMWGPSWA